jgi:heme/copper-type cytochrome/quinol oxidase subunit 4
MVSIVFFDLNCETVTIFFIFALSIKGGMVYRIHMPTNSQFDNKMEILCSMIFVRYFLGGLKWWMSPSRLIVNYAGFYTRSKCGNKLS